MAFDADFKASEGGRERHYSAVYKRSRSSTAPTTFARADNQRRLRERAHLLPLDCL